MKKIVPMINCILNFNVYTKYNIKTTRHDDPPTTMTPPLTLCLFNRVQSQHLFVTAHATVYGRQCRHRLRSPNVLWSSSSDR